MAGGEWSRSSLRRNNTVLGGDDVTGGVLIGRLEGGCAISMDYMEKASEVRIRYKLDELQSFKHSRFFTESRGHSYMFLYSFGT